MPPAVTFSHLHMGLNYGIMEALDKIVNRGGSAHENSIFVDRGVACSIGVCR